MAKNLKNITLEEISIVDKGANPGARVTLFKRDDSNGEAEVLSKEELAAVEEALKSLGIEESNPDDNKNSNNQGDTIMAQVTKEEFSAVADSVAKLSDTVEFLTKAMSLTEAEKSYMSGLDDKKRQEFMAGDAEARKKMMGMKKSDDAEDVTKAMPESIRKMVEEANKRAEAAENIAKEERQKRLDAEYLEKAGKVYKNLSGTAQEKADMLKAIDALPEAQRVLAYKQLELADKAVGSMFSEVGKSVQGAASDDALEALAKRYASEKNVSYAVAYDAVLSTPEGERLYAEVSKHKSN